MSIRDSRVPFPLRLAVRFLPKEVREEVLGDLIEHWNLRLSEQHWLARVAWAWRQPLSTLASRLRFRRRAEKPRLGIRRERRVGLGISWLDVKLALRMLFKQPGLTLVIVNEDFVRLILGDRNPIGRRLDTSISHVSAEP